VKANKIMGLVDGIDPISNWFSSCSKSPALKIPHEQPDGIWTAKKLVQTKATRQTRFGFFVEGGTFTMGKVEDDVMHDWNNAPRSSTCSLLHG
jgi:hypothetical protein